MILPSSTTEIGGQVALLAAIITRSWVGAIGVDGESVDTRMP